MAATEAVTLRRAEARDLAPITDIYNHAVLHTTATADYDPITVESRRKWLTGLEAAGLVAIVAESGDEVVGWGALVPYSDRMGYRFTAYDSVYLRPDFQGRGVGRTLLSHLIQHAQSAGLHSIIASVDSDNTASIRLHQSFGFQAVAHFPELVFKFDRWLDVIHLQLRL